MAGIFVYGGCVTRDTFELLKGDHELKGYVARQSLISAASPPTDLAGPVEGEGFEFRAVQGDLNSTLHPALAESNPDIFVMDLLVERFGVLELPDGTYVTRTPNMRKSGALGAMWDTAPHIGIGKDRHFDMWTAAVEKLAAHLREIKLFDKTLLFETAWAGVTDKGEPVRPYAGWPPERAAAIYEPYYAKVREIGFQTAALPHELAVSTEGHTWGVSPHHYVPAAYEWMRDEILAVLKEKQPA